MFGRMSTTVVTGVITSVIAMSPAIGQDLIVNGGFELGGPVVGGPVPGPWVVVNQPGSSGNFFAGSFGGVPLNGTPSVGPAGGQFYAVSGQLGAGARALSQSFFVPGPAASVILTFDMFVNSWGGGPIVNPAGLTYTAGPNQHARVDITTPGAGLSNATVLSNLYTGVDPLPNPNNYTAYDFDITAIVGGGGFFDIRFAEVDNQGFLAMGIDNVSIMYTAIPAPSVLGLLAIAGGGLLSKRRRRT